MHRVGGSGVPICEGPSYPHPHSAPLSPQTYFLQLRTDSPRVTWTSMATSGEVGAPAEGWTPRPGLPTSPQPVLWIQAPLCCRNSRTSGTLAQPGLRTRTQGPRSLLAPETECPPKAVLPLLLPMVARLPGQHCPPGRRRSISSVNLARPPCPVWIKCGSRCHCEIFFLLN